MLVENTIFIKFYRTSCCCYQFYQKPIKKVCLFQCWHWNRAWRNPPLIQWRLFNHWGYKHQNRKTGCAMYHNMNVKGVTHGPGPMFASKRLKTGPEKMPFKSVWKLSVVQAKVADEIISRVFGLIISTISKRVKMDTWRSDVFFSVGEAASLKWTHGEVTVFGSTVY